MPLKPSYLLMTGAGALIAYSGFKGLGLSSAFKQTIQGQSPAGLTQLNTIQAASYSSGYGYGLGVGPGGNPSTGSGTSGGQKTVTTAKIIPPPAGASGALSAAAAKALGFTMVVAAGWGSQWADFNNVVMAESGWQTTIHNGGGYGYVPGLAYGIPQALPGDKMASAGSNWMTSSYTQIKWMIGYIRSVYGDPAHAWAHEQAVHWY